MSNGKAIFSNFAVGLLFNFVLLKSNFLSALALVWDAFNQFVYFQIISYVTESISVFLLVLTFIVLFVLRRRIKTDRTYIQINLVVSLTLFHLTSLLHNQSVLHSRTCEIAAVSLHYFAVASGKKILF